METRTEYRKETHVRLGLLIPVMLGILLLMMILATAVGAVNIPIGRTVRIILQNWGLISGPKIDGDPIIYQVRLPRVIIAAMVGAALASSGAVMQGMFRNPMAEPGIIGVSSGAGLGAIVAIALGVSAISFYLPLFAAVGAIMAASVVYFLSQKNGRVPTLTLILSGMAVSTFIGAITSILLTKINDYQVRTYLFWTMGGLKDRSWDHVKISVLPIMLGVIVLMAFSKDLNIMLLGEEEAQSVGLNPSKTRRLLILLTSVTTAAAVSVSGSISFVGLITPHIMRLIFGPDHRVLLPASAIGGSIFLVGCDILSRTVSIPQEVGVGIITALIGSPYFIFLLLKTKKEGGAVQ